MNLDATLDDLRRQLTKLGTKTRAEQEKKYLKSDFRHYGVRVPEVRKVAKALAKADPPPSRADVIALGEAAFATDEFELRSVAIGVSDLRRRELTAADMTPIERWLRASKTWAHVDWLAVAVAGDLAERFPAARKRLDQWAKDDDFWIRRSAMLALIPGLRRGEGDFDGFAAMAVPMLGDTEFFIRKAIGWVLRETTKHRPDLVEAFVLAHATRMSGLTFREATRKLPAKAQARCQKRRG